MGIKTVGGIQEILNKHDAQNWTKSARMGGLRDFKWTSELDALVSPSSSQNQETFGDMLAQSLSNINDLQHKANESIQKLVTGESKNIHETILAVEEAEIAFKTMNQIRQKVLDAYGQVMKMQV